MQPIPLKAEPRLLDVFDQVDPLDRQRRLIGQSREKPALVGRK